MKTRNNASDYSRQVLLDIKQLSPEEVLDLHGIEINQEDGSVYDQAYNKSFVNIAEWIAFSAEDEDNEFEKFGYNDEYFV